MFTRLAAVTGALLLASGPVMATTNPTLQWNGQINRSCALTADQVGTVVLNGKSGGASRLDSTVTGGQPAILGYSTVGGAASVGFTRGSVTRNGAELLNGADHRRLEIKYAGRQNWVTVYQNSHNNWVNNQQRLSVDGTGTVEVEARTNAHLLQDNTIQTGAYVVKTTMTCHI